MTRTSSSQRRAAQSHRRRAAARGLVRVEVQATKSDTALIRAIAETLLRGEPGRVRALRAILCETLMDPQVGNAFDIFGSDLPDEAFAGVFDQPRERSDTGWRPVDL